MAFHIRDPETDRVVRELAKRTGRTLTETIRLACENELAREAFMKLPLADRIRPIQERVAAYPKTGLDADKAFYDSLNDE